MARSSYQKLKPLYIMKYLLQNTDEDHPVTVNQIISFLDSQGISAERKSIYSDIEALQYFGLDIVQAGSGRSCGYYVAHRNFELPELKLLVDSVQSSKFITHKKTATLIKKIETLASIHEAQLLIHQNPLLLLSVWLSWQMIPQVFALIFLPVRHRQPTQL